MALKKNSIKYYIENYLPPILFFILIILIWEGIVTVFKVPNYLVPAPHEIADKISKTFGNLVKDTGITMLEAILGFFLANLGGIFLAVLFVHSRIVEKSIYPYAIALKAVPLIAIAPLLVILVREWFAW